MQAGKEVCRLGLTLTVSRCRQPYSDFSCHPGTGAQYPDRPLAYNRHESPISPLHGGATAVEETR